MQNDVFNPVADTVNRRSELLLKEQNCFTVIDESIPSPREIQSEDTIVLPEIVSMTDYIHRHYEGEIIAACMNQIYGLQLCVMYEGKLFHDVPGLGPIDYGEEELILTDELSPGEWGEPCEFEHQPRVYAADVRPVDGSITWTSFRRIADGCIEADLTIEMEFYFRYGGHGRFKQITQKYYTTLWMDMDDSPNVEFGDFSLRRHLKNDSGVKLDEYLVPVYKWDDIEEESENIIFHTISEGLSDSKWLQPGLLAERLGLNIVYLPLYKRPRTASILFFGPGEVLTAADSEEKLEPIPVKVNGNTIVLNTRKPGQERDAIFHECFHYVEHRLFFQLQQLHNTDISYLAKWKPVELKKDERTEEDGLTYLLLGILSSAYNLTLFPEHPLFRFVDGAFTPLSQVGYQAYAEVGTLRTETQTAIEQTNAAIALKADQTAMDAMSERMDSAELKLQPDQLMSSIRSSSLYRYDRFGGRNYVLDSDGPYSFEGGYYKYPSGNVSTYTGLQLSVSDDLFEHSGNGATFRISFDIKRTDIDAASASTAGVYFGIWVYYRCYASDGTTINTTGRGYYLRTTDSDFVATDSDWVRVTKGPMNIASYSPISIAYVSIGTTAAAGSTGSLQIRNVKCEVGDSFTDWTAAPEDLNDLPGRMTSAESSITQNANNIALKVSTSTYNIEKVYRGSTAPTTKYTNMLWLDTSVSPNLLKRYTGSTWVVAGAEEVKSSGVYIGPNQVSITTENFLLQLLDPSDNENVLMEMSANGNVGFKELYADEVISDSVASAYAGSTWLWVEPGITTPTDTDFRSLGEAVQALNNKYLREDVYIYLPYGSETYEPSGVVIRGISGPGKLVIYGNGENSILNSHIKVQGCFAHICFQNLHLRESRTLNGSSYQPYLVEVTKCHFVEFNSCTLDANGITYDSVYARSSHVYLYNCGLYNALQGLECYLPQGTIKNCCGSCSWSMISYASIIIASGTVPAGSRGTGENGQLFASSVTVDYGTAIPTVTPDETGILFATTTKSWRGSWRTDTMDIIQGVYYDSGYNSSLNWNRGCMWFNNAQNLLWGCTVKSATLTLHRKTGSGSSAAKSVYLCAITNTSASGTPSIARNYGAIGTIGRDKQVTFSIPVDAVQGLADGYYGGLCLYETPYNFGSSTYSNAYMRMSGTDTNYEPYIECVFSGSTAVG